MADLTDYFKQIQELEDTAPFMYVDSTGNVTVGSGHNLTALQDHTKLPFKTTDRFERKAVAGGDRGVPITVNKMVGRNATPEEIQNDFNFLNKHKGLSKFGIAIKITHGPCRIIRSLN